MTDEEKKSTPKAKMVAVRVVSHSKETVLLEWVEKGKLKRGVLPRSYEAEKVKDSDLEAATPFGLPFEDLLKINAKPDDIAEGLRQAGIWTLHDLDQNPRVALGVLAKYLNLNLGALRGAIKGYLKENT